MRGMCELVARYVNASDVAESGDQPRARERLPTVSLYRVAASIFGDAVFHGRLRQML